MPCTKTALQRLRRTLPHSARRRQVSQRGLREGGSRKALAMNDEKSPTAPGRAINKQKTLTPAFRGPVPISWLTSAARLPGKSLHVGLAICYAAGRFRSQRISLSNVEACRFGLNRNAKYRALEWLETAELISVERKQGRAPVVTVRPVMSAPDRTVGYCRSAVGGAHDRKP